VIDVESLLREISAEEPCGKYLEYEDQAYRELVEYAKGTPAQYKGDEQIVPGKDPDWTVVQERALDLLTRSKDMQIALYLTVAALKTERLAGFRDGLAVICGFIERYWDTVYPRLDPSDPDPIERKNLLYCLSPRPGGAVNLDPFSFRLRLREVPLCSVPGLGTFNYRDIQLARGEISVPEGTEAPKMADIEAAFAGTPEDALLANVQALEDAAGHVRKIQSVFAEHAGTMEAPDFEDTLGLLASMRASVAKYVASSGPVAEAEAPAGVAAAPAAVQAPAAAQAVAGEIRSRNDVIRALEKICQYYATYEPSSPVPLLARRAQQLVAKNFLEIINNLAPEAIQQVEGYGPKPES